jgi:signal transduction histidine kinase
LTVQDNGSGAADTSGGFGLIGIRERVQLLGGEFRVETAIGKGFLLEVTVPVIEDEK